GRLRPRRDDHRNRSAPEPRRRARCHARPGNQRTLVSAARGKVRARSFNKPAREHVVTVAVAAVSRRPSSRPSALSRPRPAGGVVAGATVRRFGHRSVRIVHELERQLTTAILVACTDVIDPGPLARAAGAQMYCPDFEYLDEQQVRLAHAAGVRVVPWTVNE